MSPSKKPQTPIRISPAIRERLDAEVKRTGLSINTIVMLALDRYLPQIGDAPAAPAALSDDSPLDFD